MSQADECSHSWNIFRSLESLCKRNSVASSKLDRLICKQIWNTDDRNRLLEALSVIFLDPSCTEHVCEEFKPIISDVVERSLSKITSENSVTSKTRYCVALSKGVTLCTDLYRFAAAFLKDSSPFLLSSEVEVCPPRKKKIKKDEKICLELCIAAYRFSTHLPDESRHIITVDQLMPYLNHELKDVKWFSVQIISRLLKMSPFQKEHLLSRLFKDDEKVLLTLRYSSIKECSAQECHCVGEEMDRPLTHSMHSIFDSDLSECIVSVGGILLPKLISSNTNTEVTQHSLVPVESMKKNLKRFGSAVAAGQPVLLQGPIGCGKTSIVKHLAVLTGRAQVPHLMKIQLGDQTDSKALLGTYTCTEIPGEFVWQPGILTQAVTAGHWVLLEDIDSAPMDVISILLPLLENKTLSVPGHGDSIKVSENFRLFATQRLIGSSTGWHRQHGNNSSLLDKLWTKINMEPLSRTELSDIVKTRYPELITVTDKLLEIYFMLSASKHELSSVGDSVSQDDSFSGQFISVDGRLISTRDLINWCNRIYGNIKQPSSTDGNLIFQEAVDCFVACLSTCKKRYPLAEAIGAKLNLTKAQVEFNLTKYRPEIEITESKFRVGRIYLKRKKEISVSLKRTKSVFSYTRQSALLLERVAVCIRNNEPVLLVGETGTGKTSSVQYLAQQLGHELRVINMNQQSDSTDLLGGFKPVDMKYLVKPFREEFEMLFRQTFSWKQNMKFLSHVQDCYVQKKWKDLFSLMHHVQKSAVKKFPAESHENELWVTIGVKLQNLKLQVKKTENVLAFSFIEGALVKALRNGDWVLLDEINLATAETLECLSGLLESISGSVVLTERGDIEPVIRHEEFRLFACMNPATDIGKKDLPIGIRNRFTEFFVDELEETQDLKILVNDYLKGLSLSTDQINGIVKFYLTIRDEAVKHLTDGTGHRPHFSLRTLCRALNHAAQKTYGQVARSLFEGFCLSFLTQLDRSSHPIVESLITKYVVGKTNVKSLLNMPLPEPSIGKNLKFEGYWISVGTKSPSVPENYILTPSVRKNLRDLARVVSAGCHPVLLQGDTSVGKTSLISWLAQSSGNHCLRVNNHDHTDLQEYVGCYAADESGKLVFKEGVLVEAMRKGYWIILDELNLAPSDVLEALNRLLDDNRELFIPETQETVKAHPKFMLFATQNPPGHYGGRKMLSRAFRNRFIELHFDEIPSKELESILNLRCALPASYAKKLVNVMLELQKRRRGSGVFAGKKGFMTLRDLFRWAERYHTKDADVSGKFHDWDQHLADHGYMLLAGRVRKEEEAITVQEVIQKHLKRSVQPDNLFTLNTSTSPTTVNLLKQLTEAEYPDFSHVVWTYNMRRQAVLVAQAVKYNEPVLLVGETGCGKTTVCQMLAEMYVRRLHSVNCHLHTESADFLGGLRPVRSHEDTEMNKELKLFEWIDGPLVSAMKEGSMFLIDEISLADDSVLERLNSILEPERTLLLAEKAGGDGDKNTIEQIVASDGFQVFSTMNPGGDFGKKELSPALRNRFTEIWCSQSNNKEDLLQIIEHNVSPGIHLCNQEDGSSGIGKAMLGFIDWFKNNEISKRCVVSIRDILSWVNFINICSEKLSEDRMESEFEENLDPVVAYIHGACLVFIDGLGSGTVTQGPASALAVFRDACTQFLLKQVTSMTHQNYEFPSLGIFSRSRKLPEIIATDYQFYIEPFCISKGTCCHIDSGQYALKAPTTCLNAQRVLRGLQLSRPLLLEGSPGVGKTSLVAAIARASGHELVRINLSEQTDVTDLFGADLPTEGAEGGRFSWRDGPLLQALKAGHWIMLDELNLASQSVLEGLNACLDHRAEVFIPELARSFHIQHERTRIFACQNPLNQGGGRKGLPRSFLNRFTQVYIEPLTEEDLLFILKEVYIDFPTGILNLMVKFNTRDMTLYWNEPDIIFVLEAKNIHDETVIKSKWGRKGSPWEFNLRDLFRWCDLMCDNQIVKNYNPGEYVGIIYKDRMRTADDKQKVLHLYTEIFPDTFPLYTSTGHFSFGEGMMQVGHSFLPQSDNKPPKFSEQGSFHLLHHTLEPLESVMNCVKMNWMFILVGPQASGKTGLIKLLSQLTRNSLQVLSVNSAMDTTELLGGFEQADVGCHIEEAASKIEDLMSNIFRELLSNECFKQTKTFVETICNIWKSYRNTQPSGTKISNIEEKNLHKKKVNLLKDVIALFRTQEDLLENFTEAIDHTELKVLKAHKTLENMTPGSDGGSFEWIDSLLVKALTEGNWLLIDNVNFCSPSVLDRLNAVLEPNGVLSINERGVIDGEIVTIKPHPQFRLFLTMDPKFGEISRAMRNRGIEIYIPGEDDGNMYDEFDLNTLLRSLGLMQHSTRSWLIELYAIARGSLPFAEKPSLTDLCHIALLTTQQTERGSKVTFSVWEACYDVFVKSQKNSKLKNKMLELLSTHFVKLDTIQNSDKSIHITPEPGMWPLRLPSVEDYLDCIALSDIRVCSTSYCSCIELLLREADTNYKDGIPEFSNVIPNFRLMLDLLPRHAQVFHSAWLTQYNDTLKTRLKSLPDTRNKHSLLWKDIILSLPTSLKKILNCVELTAAWDEYTQIINKLSDVDKSVGALIQNLPLDFRWNQQALSKLIFLCDRCVGQETVEEIFNNMTSVFNRILIIQDLKFQEASLEPLFKKIKLFIDQECASGRKLSFPVLSHIPHLFAMLHQELINNIDGQVKLDDEKAYKFFDGLQWIEHFLAVVQQCITNITGMSKQFNKTKQLQEQTLLSHHLSLHWQWLYKKTVRLFVPDKELDTFTGKFETILTELHKQLGSDQDAAKQFVIFWLSFGYPEPFRTSEHAEIMEELKRLIKKTDINSATEMIQDKRVRLLKNERHKFCQIVRNIIDLIHGETEIRNQEGPLSSRMSSLKQLLQKHNIIVSEDSMDIEGSVSLEEQETDKIETPLSFVCLWPLFEYQSLLSELNICSSRQTEEKLNSDLVDYHVDYCQSYTTQSPLETFLIAHMKGLSKAKQTLLSPTLWKNLFNRLWKSPVACKVDKWLTWKQCQDNELQSAPRTKGIDGSGSFNSALLSHICSRLLISEIDPSGKNKSSEEMFGLFQVPVGVFQNELKMLELFHQHVWSHTSVISQPSKDACFLDKQLFETTLCHLLSSLNSLLCCEKWETGIVEFRKELCVSKQAAAKNLENLLNYSKNSIECVLGENTYGLLEKLSELFCLLQNNEDTDIIIIGQCWVYVGIILTSLLRPMGPVDPVEKQEIKLKYVLEELDKTQREINVRDMHNKMLTGKLMNKERLSMHHPRIKYLLNKQMELRTEAEVLKQRIAYRPHPSQYPELLQDINSYLSTSGSVDRIMNMMNKLLALHKKLTEKGTSFSGNCNILSEEFVWQMTQQKFTEALSETYACYQDITDPFITGIYQIMHGMHLIASDVRKKHILKELCQSQSLIMAPLENKHLTNAVSCLMKFPSICMKNKSLYSLVQSFLMDQTAVALKILSSGITEQTQGIVKKFNTRLLLSTLKYIVIHGQLTGEITQDILYVVLQVLHKFVSSWQEHEQEKKEKELEEESLYRFKSKLHGSEKSEEELEEYDFKQNYPDYAKDFVDVVDKACLESDEPTDTAVEEGVKLEGLTISDMHTIRTLHEQLFTTLTNQPWLAQKKNENDLSINWVQPFISTYTVGANLVKNAYQIMDRSLDKEIQGGHLVTAQSIQESVILSESVQIVTKNAGGSFYNVYFDSNVSEVVQCRPVLKTFTNKVNQLREEWPDHPTLKQLISIVEKVLSFPVTDPLMKFVTGLELLVEKAQDWEDVAAKHVSMITELCEVNGLIIRWRKIELSCWNHLMDTQEKKCVQIASKWWFYLYQLIESFLSPPSETNQGPNSKDSAEALGSCEHCDIVTPFSDIVLSWDESIENQKGKILQSLKCFMETSPLGEYTSRLDMIHAFHCQISNLTVSTNQNDILCMLWNVYHFYKQFIPVVQAEIEKLRAPIQKELKGLVKISRWTDRNYWALKQSTIKIHKQLHKQTKQFQVILQQPVTQILDEKKNFEELINEKDTPVSSETHLTDYILKTTAEVDRVIPEFLTSEMAPLQFRLPILGTKLCKHWGQILSQSKFMDNLNALEEFTGDVIESVHELQSLDVSKDVDKDKQKSEAKHINLRKRKALSDLFKYLADIGLSYRKGLTMFDLDNKDKLDEPLHVPPVDLSNTKRVSENTKQVWKNGQRYFYRCLSRRAQFYSALRTPSQELGTGNLDRCKGFIEHLISLIVDQHTQTSSASTTYCKFRTFMNLLKKCNDRYDDEEKHVSKEASHICEQIRDLGVSIKEGLGQFQVVLKCCPKQTAEVVNYPSPFPPSLMSVMAQEAHGGLQWQECMDILECVMKTVSGIQERCSEFIHCSLLKSSDMRVLRDCSADFETCRDSLTYICDIFADPVHKASSCLTESLQVFIKEINTLCSGITQFVQKVNNLQIKHNEGELQEKTTIFISEVESLIAGMLLGIQTIASENVSNEGVDSEKDDEELTGLLTKKVHGPIQKNWQSLSVKKNLENLEQLVGKLTISIEEDFEAGVMDRSVIYSRLLYRLSSITEQYSKILECYVDQMVHVYKSTGKLTSVLLALFTELTLKGFCLPPELSDAEGEGATEFVDIEDGGMGEGEGVKDVSDQIETEDQLDEARKPGEEKKDDESEKPDIKAEDNAIEMTEEFEGKLHDLDAEDGDKSEEENDTDVEEGLDKQMGDLEDKDADKLDEQMWGSDEEQEEENEENKTKEEDGPGAGKSESQLVAKDDVQDKTQTDESECKDKEDGEENTKPHEQEDFDERDYDEDQIDPHHGKQEPENEPETMDLPEDLNLDRNEMDVDNEEEPETQDEHDNEESFPDPENQEQLNENSDEKNEKPEGENAPNDKEDEEARVDEEQQKQEEESSSVKVEEEAKEEKKEERTEEDGDKNPGFGADEEPKIAETEETEDSSENPEMAEKYGVTQHDTQNVEQSENAQDAAGEKDNQENESDGMGLSVRDEPEGYEGEKSTQYAKGAKSENKKKALKRQPGVSDSDRSLGDLNNPFKKLKTIDQPSCEQDEDSSEIEKKSDAYQHIKDAKSHFDAQTLDVATGEQQQERPIPNLDVEESASDREDEEMPLDDSSEQKNTDESREKNRMKLKSKSEEKSSDNVAEEGDVNELEKEETMTVSGDLVKTLTAERPPETSIHTALEHLHLDRRGNEFDMEKLREELEEQLSVWSQEYSDTEKESVAMETWHKYEALTCSLSQELCEQLRLVLEPSQATKLKGDYRTGKRLNMRKVIPYIASQFRKDKIWLRRTKPSKRQYQIMLAIDDSSSMVDNHSKQLAFESLALISNALTLLEAGELSICSFGETVKLLHHFSDQFTNHSGAKILQHFTFEQTKTKIAQLLKHATKYLVESQSRQQSFMGNPDTSQLLLIVSDGRGLFMEGMEVVKNAVRQAREAGIFLVFLILDNPVNKDSILDIRVPIFHSTGQMPEIISYMDSFPFPFYIILKDINSMPQTLSDALRQWFELVTAVDR